MGQIKKLEESSQQTASNPNCNQAAFKAAAGKPVLEILDAEKKPTEHLKIGAMEDSFIEGSVIKEKGKTPATFNPEQDKNKFFIRLKDINECGEKQIDVKLSTQNPNPDYDEKDRTVVLREKGEESGIFESDPLLLTSDIIDDTVVVNEIEDNQCDEKRLQCDQTFKTMLGGKVQVDYLDENNVLEASATAKVPIVKELDVSINILKKDGQAVISQEEVEKQIKETNEAFAVAGIKVNANIAFVDVPQGVDLTDGFSQRDSKAFFDKLGTPDTDDLQIFYVGHFDKVDKPAGEGLFAGGYATYRKTEDEKISNTIVKSSTKVLNKLSREIGHIEPNDDNDLNTIVMSLTKVPNVLTHEIGHLLTKEGHYPENLPADAAINCDLTNKEKRNVMMGCGLASTITSDLASNSKRWTSEQIEKMLKSSLLKEPEPEKQSLEEKEEEEKEKKPRLAVR